jgi:prepilin-type processing-associated H-X9-DG protein
MSPSHRPRAGFSLINLLVVIAVIGILIGLLLPAVQKVREAANRLKSANNLKLLALACHNYHDANGSLPPGYGPNHFSAVAYLLPYLEQDNLYKSIDFKKPITDKANETARKTVLKLLLSPRDEIRQVTPDSGATNYLFNAGLKPALEDNDGVFYQDSKIKFPDITDGTSNTLMAGETLKGDGLKRAVDVRRQYVFLTDDKALNDLKDDSGVRDFKQNKNIAGDRCARWIDGSFLQGTFTGTRPLNDSRPDVSVNGLGGLSALRIDSPVVNVAFCDGSVRAVGPQINTQTWKALSTRNGGEVIQLP